MDTERVVVMAQRFEPQDWQSTDVVTFYDLDGEVLTKALAFTTEVLNSSSRCAISPTPCVYVPPSFIGNDHALFTGHLVSAGAIPLGDDDFSTVQVAPPRSPEDFARAVRELMAFLHSENSL